MLVFNILGAAVAFFVVLIGQFWLLAQIDPPGGKFVRATYLGVMILVALFFAFVVFNGAGHLEDTY